jgi:hypothetical protein
MQNVDITIFDQILVDYLTIRKNLINNYVQSNKNIVNYFVKHNKSYSNDLKENLSQIVENACVIHKLSEKQNEQTSCDLNVFRMFGVGETMHSFILSHFLNPNSDHGQKHLFLNIFLDLLGIKRLSDNENWVVTAEKGRIDVLLKRIHPHSVIVIENKSNYAGDTENQLYRYWYREIYKAIGNIHLSEDYILNPPEEYYQLIYLTPTNMKVPSNNSLSRPIGWDIKLPKVVPLKTKELIFNDFIVRWLNISLEQIPIQNYRLKEYIKQYIEFWT